MNTGAVDHDGTPPSAAQAACRTKCSSVTVAVTEEAVTQHRAAARHHRPAYVS
ncbi:MAG TPA: hypothetical protein VGL46_23450 [Pseudonocardiaceae bacterium]